MMCSAVMEQFQKFSKKPERERGAAWRSVTLKVSFRNEDETSIYAEIQSWNNSSAADWNYKNHFQQFIKQEEHSLADDNGAYTGGNSNGRKSA